MKISKSKQELARIISENGGWRECAGWSVFGKKSMLVVFVDESNKKPIYDVIGKSWPIIGNSIVGEFGCLPFPNWHQTILSRAEYFHLYPAPDADGWIEWNGTDRPSGYFYRIIDVKLQDGREMTDSSGRFGWDTDGPSRIIAYRPHKPERVEIADFNPAGDGVTDDTKALQDAVNSMSKSKAVGDDETNLAAKGELEAMECKPTIEQLAADYRNAKYYADRKQQEADVAKADADSKLKSLELAGEVLGLLVTPITAKQEPELVITDWRGLRVGDRIWVGDSGHDNNCPAGEYDIADRDHGDDDQPFGVMWSGRVQWPQIHERGWRFIRRP